MTRELSLGTRQTVAAGALILCPSCKTVLLALSLEFNQETVDEGDWAVGRSLRTKESLLFLRFLDHSDGFFPVWNVGDRLAYLAPLFAPIGADQQRGPQSNIGASV